MNLGVGSLKVWCHLPLASAPLMTHQNSDTPKCFCFDFMVYSPLSYLSPSFDLKKTKSDESRKIRDQRCPTY